MDILGGIQLGLGTANSAANLGNRLTGGSSSPTAILGMQSGLAAAEQFGLFGNYASQANAAGAQAVFGNQSPAALLALSQPDSVGNSMAGIIAAALHPAGASSYLGQQPVSIPWWVWGLAAGAVLILLRKGA